MRRGLIAFALLTLGGCTLASKPADPKPTARINDVTVPQTLDRGYGLVEVDGRPAPRAHATGLNYWIVDMVPFKDVPPGTHTFTVRRRADGTSGKFTATVEAGKQYRIDLDSNGAPTLVAYNE
jgi:hypothetical protein